MRTEHTILKKLAWGAPLLLGSMLFVQCSSDNTADRNADTMSADGVNNEMADDNTVTRSELDAEVNAMYDEQNAATGSTTTGSTVSTTTVTYTPAKERVMATNDMRGLRNLLVADLEAVRVRLNDGARPAPAREADKALAADLAQGLERVDRALEALGASTDATWASMRDVQLKEVSEVRSWMADYRSQETWSMK